MVEHPRRGYRNTIPFGDCPEGVSGHDTTGTTDGTCTWCGRRVDPRRPRPVPRGWVNELDEAYGTHWDPDWTA